MPTALASPAQNYDGHPVKIRLLTNRVDGCIIATELNLTNVETSSHRCRSSVDFQENLLATTLESVT